MQDIILMTVFGAGAVAAMLLIWFHTMVPVRILKRLPKKWQGDWFDRIYPDPEDKKYLTRDDYMLQFSVNSSLHRLLRELMNCHYCLGTHFTIWTSMIPVMLGCYTGLGWHGILWWFLSASTQFTLGLLVYKHTKI